MDKKYRYVGTHADSLDSGRPLAPGDFVTLSDEDIRQKHNEMLAADGKLIGVDDASEHQQKLADRRVTRRNAAEESNDGEEG